MAEVLNRIDISYTSIITLTEDEMRALDALVGYGDDAFIKHFKENLGRSYIENHERGLRSFFRAVKDQVLPAIHEIDETRRKLAQKVFL